MSEPWKMRNSHVRSLAKMILVAKLDSEFLYKNCKKSIVNVIIHLNGHDNNYINQAFFNKFDTVENKPWIGKMAYT